ncbi:MAG: PLP-dependent aminotransferase family protein [Actinomycetota bacterium]
MAENTPDPYVDLYARRTAGMSASEVRALFAVASRPEVISLAGGMPFVQALPREHILEVVTKVITERGDLALQYGGGVGHLGLRERLADLLNGEGIAADPGSIVITMGGQQALDIIGRIFIDPGDQIAVEAPSYVGALSAFSAYEPEFLQVPLDDEGMIVDELEAHLRGGVRPAFVYTVPNFHNPAGVTMSLARREQLVAVCRDAGIPIIEDDPYRALRFDGDPIPALRTLDPANVIYLSSLSKVFAAGIRIGYVTAEPSVLQRFLPAKEAADLCPSNLSQLIAEEYLSDERWEANLQTLIDIYRERRDACLAALAEHFPTDATWTHPSGGFYVWATLPDVFDTARMLPTAVERRVAYVPGTAFYPDGSGANRLRLAYCYPDAADVAEGVRRLSGLLNDEESARAAATVPGAVPGRAAGS